MVDWKASMQQTFEFYTVDPVTWRDRDRLTTVKQATINRDSETETLGSATFDVDGQIGERYIRVYLVTTQNGITERHPLGTFLVQTPTTSFNGKVMSRSMDAYTPLLELKEKQPPIGFTLERGSKILYSAKRLAQENMRAPVIAETDKPIIEVDELNIENNPIAGAYYRYDDSVYMFNGKVFIPSDIINRGEATLKTHFTAETEETWLTYLTNLLANENHTFALDEMGNVMFAPVQETSALQPVETFDDSNSSILYPDITVSHDIYGIPNVVEVVCSTPTREPDGGSATFAATAINDDPNSPTSTVNRGRKIIYRDTDPKISGVATQENIEAYAKRLLKDLSTVEYTLSYTHGYCPVRLGDCVRLNYTRAGIHNIKAKVVSQTIQCVPGCPVTEKAVFTTNLWTDLTVQNTTGESKKKEG